MNRYDTITYPLAIVAGIAAAEGHYFSAVIIFLFSLGVMIVREMNKFK